MTEEELIKRIEVLERKTDENAVYIKKIRSYFFWTFVISIAVIVLPLIGLMFIIPQFLDTYQGLGL